MLSDTNLHTAWRSVFAFMLCLKMEAAAAAAAIPLMLSHISLHLQLGLRSDLLSVL